MLSVATSEGSTDRKQCISQSSLSNIITKGLEKNNPVHLPCDLIGHQIRVTPWGTLHKNSFFFSIFGTALKISFSFRWSQNAYLKYAIRKYDISLSKKVKLFPLLIFTLFWMDQTKCIFPYRKGFFFSTFNHYPFLVEQGVAKSNLLSRRKSILMGKNFNILPPDDRRESAWWPETGGGFYIFIRYRCRDNV